MGEANYDGAEQIVGTDPPTDGHITDIFESGPMTPTPRRWMPNYLRQMANDAEATRERVEAELADVPRSQRRRVENVTQGGLRNLDQTDNPDVRGTQHVHPPKG